MAEISESEPLNHSLESGASSRRSTMPGTKRLILTLSILFPFLAGLPFLLKSTEIYRSTLPFSSIDSLSARVLPDPPPPACQLHAIFLRPVAGISAGRMVRLISEEVDKRIKSGHSCGSCGRNYAVSVTIDSGNECTHSGGGEGNSCFWPCGEVDSSLLSKDDVIVDEMLDAALRKGGQCMGSGGGKLYTILLGESEAHEGFRNVVGKHRHAWVVNGNVRESDAALIIAKIFVKFFMNGGKEGVLQRNGEFVPVGLDGSIVLSFSLLNANPNDWVYDWDFQEIDEVMLAPLVEALAPVANIHIESQVLYHTPKSSISKWADESGGNIFGLSDLPFFVNSSEWHLDTSIAAAGRSKILQFVVYVPTKNECPLLVQLPDGQISKTNGFISPRWGGVILWNPPDCSADFQSRTLIRRTMPRKQLQKIFQVFVGQLRLLFGFKSDIIPVDDVDMINILAGEKGFTEWQLSIENFEEYVQALGQSAVLKQTPHGASVSRALPDTSNPSNNPLSLLQLLLEPHFSCQSSSSFCYCDIYHDDFDCHFSTLFLQASNCKDPIDHLHQDPVTIFCGCCSLPQAANHLLPSHAPSEDPYNSLLISHPPS